MNKTTTFLAFALAALTLLPSMADAAGWQYPKAIAANDAAPVTAAPAAVIATTPFFNVTSEDVGRAVAEQIKSQGIETKTVRARLNPGTPLVLYSADHALRVNVQALQIDPATHRWQGQAVIVSGGRTETIKPVAGTYETIIQVPVLTRQLGTSDVIEASDLGSIDMPERQLHKDTVTDASSIIGKSPRRGISPDRPIRTAEIMEPVVIKKGQPVDMTFTTPYVHIRAQGEALEDGSVGALIRVKNNKSEKAVSARVVSAGHVETNTEAM